VPERLQKDFEKDVKDHLLFQVFSQLVEGKKEANSFCLLEIEDIMLWVGFT
jgi:hypothetical protein